MTLGDVAVAAGVSPSTASRVLNGGKPVSVALDERVREAAARVGYVSNAVASAMRGRRGLLAILTDELGVEALAELAIAAGIAATAAELTTTVSSAGTAPEDQILALRLLRSLRPRALVLAGGWTSAPTIREELQQELAAFTHDADADVVVLGPAVPPYPAVRFDDYGDGVLIARHMASTRGGSALVLAGPVANESLADRARGIISGLEDSGITNVRAIHCENDSHDAEVAVIDHISDVVPDMVLCVNDRIALGAYAALDGLGLRIPRDVAVSGIDDLPVAEHLQPPLTTIAHPLIAVGQAVVGLALSAGAESSSSLVFGGVLVERASSGPAG